MSNNALLSLTRRLSSSKSTRWSTLSMKAACLLKSSGTLEVLTFKLRLMLELKLVNETRVFQMQSEAQEIDRMLGGWLKSVQSM